jgi:hypothetical protein
VKCEQVNKNNGRGSYNADSYVWFAMEAFLLQNPSPYGCGSNKLDPPLQYFVDPAQTPKPPEKPPPPDVVIES